MSSIASETEISRPYAGYEGGGGTPKIEKSKKIILIYEAFGTCMLMVIYNWVAGSAMYMGLGLFTLMILFGDITGGHFNPCITIAVMIKQLKNEG